MVDNSNSYKDRVSRLISWGHWFMLANIIIAMLMAIRYVFAVDGQLSFISVIYVFTTWVGHFGLLGILAYIIVLFPLTFVFPSSKIMRALGAILATCAIVGLMIDGSVFQNYQLHLNLLAFDLKGFNLNNTIGWSSIGLFLLALLLVELTIANLIWKRLAIIRDWDVGNKLTLFFTGAFLTSHLIHIWADAAIYKPVLAYDQMFPMSHQSTARSLIKKYGWINDQHTQQLNLSKAPSGVNYPLNPLQCSAPTNNLLTVSIAAINPEHVTHQLMPNLFALAKRSINATNHITSSLSKQDVEFTLGTGLPASYQNAFSLQQLSSPLVSLTNNSTRKKFSSTQDAIARNAAMQDKRNITDLISWIGQQHGPYFAELTLYASQELSVTDDYTPMVTVDQQMSPADRLLATQYLISLAQTDALIGELLASVDLSTTTVVVTGNRGNDLSSIYHRSDAYSAVNLRVPLIVALPEMPAQIIEKNTSHYDVLPTLLRHHFRCGNPESDTSIGFDILSTQSSPLFYIGTHDSFALYQETGIAEIDRQGNFRFYDHNYQRLDDGKLSFQHLINLMANINRFK